jgi:precorrin-6x reductase
LFESLEQARKIRGPRELGLPVVLVSRPVRSAARVLHSAAAVLTWIDARKKAKVRRGSPD